LSYVDGYSHFSRTWNETEEFVEQTFDVDAHFTEDGLVNVVESLDIFTNLGSNFHRVTDRQCHGLKTTLLALEDQVPGRVRLIDFYNKSFYSIWDLKEKPEYLRTLGALDETESQVPRVIITNYMQAMPNCINPSNLYSICCRNECEDLMAHLERHVAAPMADSSRILELVAALPSETVVAPRKLPESLRSRLQEIAMTHNGFVPLHGRLFAQWMHHAYPRECPYPHLSGATSPQSPDEWKQLNGKSSSWETREKLQEYLLNSTCAAKGRCAMASSTASEINWNSAEEFPLLVKVSSLPHAAS